MAENKKKTAGSKIGLKQCLKQLLAFVKPYRLKLTLAMLLVIVTNLTFALNPTVEGMVTTQLAKDAEGIIKGVSGAHVHFDILFKIMAVLGVLYIIKTISQLLTAVFLTDAIQQTMHDVRNALQTKIQRLPVRYFDDHTFGDVLSTVTNDVDTLSNALQQTLQRVFAAVLTFIFVIIMMVRINVIMTVIALLIIPLSILITKFFVKRSQKLFEQQQQTLGELNSTITEIYGGFNEILLYNKQQDSIAKFKEVNGRMCGASFKAQFMSSMISPFVSLVTYLLIGVIARDGLYVCHQRFNHRRRFTGFHPLHMAD